MWQTNLCRHGMCSTHLEFKHKLKQCVCLCVCVYACVCVCVCVSMHVCVHVCARACMGVWVGWVHLLIKAWSLQYLLYLRGPF